MAASSGAIALEKGAVGASGRVSAGFWRRLLAAIIDGVILALVAGMVAVALGGADADGANQPGFGLGDAVTMLLGVGYTIGFWAAKGATPGKMALGLRIVDARTGGGLSIGRALLRYVGYFVSGIALFLGFLWIGFDRRKQGWHDKIAGTLVLGSTVAFDRRDDAGYFDFADDDHHRFDRRGRDRDDDRDGRDHDSDADGGFDGGYDD